MRIIKLCCMFLCFGMAFKLQAQSIIKLDKSKISFVSLDSKIRSLMKAANVQGLAITVFAGTEPYGL